MHRILFRKPRPASIERRTGLDRRSYDSQRPWANKSCHFWMSLPTGMILFTIGLGLSATVMYDNFNTMWQAPSLVPLDRLASPLFALAFTYSGIMMLADCLEWLPKRWQRFWLAWAPATMCLTWITGFAALACIIHETRPISSLCAFGSLWLGVVLFLILGPEIRDRARLSE